MTRNEKAVVAAKAAAMAGKRKSRYISEYEIEKMAAMDKKKSLAGKTIRVYSHDGFVPNSYKYRIQIDFVERRYDEEGVKTFFVGNTDAKRSYGGGAFITVDGRAC